MRTIEPPVLPKPEDRVYRVRCENRECHALLEVGHNEFKFTSDQRDGDFYQCSCPHCHRYITISSGKLKDYIVKNAKLAFDYNGK